MTPHEHTLTVVRELEEFVIQVPHGANLRQTLLEHNLSPYAWLTRTLNCGGRGLCATCGVWIDDELTPTHWHDRAASYFGYPRLSCQITITGDMRVRLVTDKWIWGARKPKP